MTYDKIHPTMREALGAFAVLRSFGFPSDDIFFHQNADEPPGPDLHGMMFVVLKTQGKTFSISVGVVAMSYDGWNEAWKKVAVAARDGQISDKGRILSESLAFRADRSLRMAIEAKGIRIPVKESARG